MAKRTKIVSIGLISMLLFSCGDNGENKQIQYSDKNDIYVIVNPDSSKLVDGQTWEEFKDSLNKMSKDSITTIN